MIKYKTSNLFQNKILFKRKGRDMGDYNQMLELKNNSGTSERKLKYPCIYKHFKGNIMLQWVLARLLII